MSTWIERGVRIIVKEGLLSSHVIYLLAYRAIYLDKQAWVPKSTLKDRHVFIKRADF